jgi:hypothetical protein
MKERWADIALVWFFMATAIVVIPTIYVLFGGGEDYLDRYDKAVTQTMQRWPLRSACFRDRRFGGRVAVA